MASRESKKHAIAESLFKIHGDVTDVGKNFTFQKNEFRHSFHLLLHDK